ncbi:MAG: MFS transporter, partial [Flavobacteriales bacterium]|nr:MFS transporter [Flavobacteriales bacterium]
MTKKERLLLFILASAQFTHIVDFMIMMPMGDILQKELLITPFQFSMLVSAYPLAAFLSSLFGVFFLDKFDRKKALSVAYLGFVLGTFSSAVVPNTADPSLNYALFIGTRLLTGLFGGILGALVLSIVGDVFALERRGKAMGVVSMAFSLAAVVGVPLALELVNQF